jgi:hypothetical protein
LEDWVEFCLEFWLPHERGVGLIPSYAVLQWLVLHYLSSGQHLFFSFSYTPKLVGSQGLDDYRHE